MPLQKEIWVDDIVGNLFKDNQFAQRAVNHDSLVLAGAVVHEPVAGAPSGTKKNLTQFPQTATERQDTLGTYPLDTIYALPRRIAKLDSYELSYDKRMSVVGEDVRNLQQNAMNSLLYRWAPEGPNLVLTTGAATAEDLIDTTATGTRKVFTKDVFKTVSKATARRDVGGQKTALLTATHYYQFFDSLSEGERTAFHNVADVANGIVGRYMGWDILMRSSVLRYRKTGGLYMPVDEQAEGFAPAAADCAASLFYTSDSVTRAVGEVDVFDNPGQALYYGDVWSAMLRIGGRIRRQAGVYAVVEDLAA